MKITLLHPSRGRAIQAKQAIELWKRHASGNIEIEYILSIDKDDIYRNHYEMKFISGSDKFVSILIQNNNTSVVDATNKAAEISTGDILVYLSDDFKCPFGWDELIVHEFKNRPHGPVIEPMLLKVDDCLQQFKADVLTIPIMNRELYNRLGYFWHPEYKSMFVDQDLYYVCKNNNWIEFAPHLKFPHFHYCNGKAKKDETYVRSEANWNSGKELFHKRKAQNFPI